MVTTKNVSEGIKNTVGRLLVHVILFCLSVSGFPTDGGNRSFIDHTCPNGFAQWQSDLIYLNCFMIKPPETSSNKYNACNGNEVPIDFYKVLSNYEHDSIVFWIDYERVYENGPFVNWRIGDQNMGIVENSTRFEDISSGGMCATVNIQNYEVKSARCDQKFPRLCVLPAAVIQGDDYKQHAWSWNLELPELDIKYARTENDLIIFNISQPISVMEEVWCFHESPKVTGRVRTDIKVMKNAEEFGVVTKGNGNYWCLCKNKTIYSSKESEKVVFVTNKQMNKNTSVLMLKKSKLLVYLLGLYPQKYEDLSKNLCPGGRCQSPSAYISLLNKKVLEKVNISEEMFFDTKVLLHLTNGTQTLLNYFVGRADVIFTRKLMVCEAIDFAPEAEVGHEVIIRRDLCKEFRCEGDYIFGAVWKVFNVDDCEQNTKDFTPDEHLKFLLYTLDDMLEMYQTSPLNATSLESVARMISTIRDSDERIKIPSRVFQNIETLVRKTVLPKNETQVKIISPNMAIVIVNTENTDSPVIGIQVVSPPDGSSISSVDVLTEEIIFHDSENISVFVNVSSILDAHPKSRISLVVYQNEVFKLTSDQRNLYDSQILSVLIGNISKFGENEYIDIKMRSQNKSVTSVCAHGEFNSEISGMTWPVEGCQRLKELENEGLATCRCNHLSHFALLKQSDGPALTREAAVQDRANDIPEKQIQYVMKTINTMMDYPVNTTSISNAATLVNSVLNLEENVTIPSIILKNLETLASKVVLPKNESQITIIKSDMAIIVADNSEEKPVVGVKISPSLDETSLLSTEILTSGWPMKHSENSIILVNVSSMLRNYPRSRVSFVVYRNDRAFLNLNQTVGGAHQTKVNSKIISIQLGNITELGKNEYVDIHFKPYENNKRNEKKACVFWNFTLGSTGQWSTAGCEFLKEAGPEGLDTCRCYRLSHFAQLITSDDRNINEFHYKILTRIFFYGSILSIIGLVIIALTGIVFKTWRRDFVHKLWMNLAASVGIMIVGFLFASEYDFGNDQSQKALCEVSGMILHYSVLSTFSWMFVIALFYYQTIVHVKPMTYSEKCVMISLGWIFPAAPIVPLFISNSDSYSLIFLNNEYDFCYPSGLGFWLGVFLPVSLLIICNALILFRIIRSIHITSQVNANRRTEGDLVQQIKRMSFLFYQFGLVWLFGLFSRYLVMAYLFCITASIQGLILSYILVLGNRNTRKLLFSKLNIGLAEEASYVKSETFSSTENLIKKNKSEEGRKMDRFSQWWQCKNSNKIDNKITTRIPVFNEEMCSCSECSEKAYLLLLNGDK